MNPTVVGVYLKSWLRSLTNIHVLTAKTAGNIHFASGFFGDIFVRRVPSKCKSVKVSVDTKGRRIDGCIYFDFDLSSLKLVGVRRNLSRAFFLMWDHICNFVKNTCINIGIYLNKFKVKSTCSYLLPLRTPFVWLWIKDFIVLLEDLLLFRAL